MKKSAKDPWADVITLKKRSTARKSRQGKQVKKLQTSEVEPPLTAQTSSQEPQVRKLQTSEAGRSSTALSIAMKRLVELVPDALDVFEEVLEGNGGRDAAVRIKAAAMVLRLSGVLPVEKPVVSSERTTPRQGLTNKEYQQLRQVLIGRVLLGGDGNEP